MPRTINTPNKQEIEKKINDQYIKLNNEIEKSLEESLDYRIPDNILSYQKDMIIISDFSGLETADLSELEKKIQQNTQNLKEKFFNGYKKIIEEFNDSFSNFNNDVNFYSYFIDSCVKHQNCLNTLYNINTDSFNNTEVDENISEMNDKILKIIVMVELLKIQYKYLMLPTEGEVSTNNLLAFITQEMQPRLNTLDNQYHNIIEKNEGTKEMYNLTKEYLDYVTNISVIINEQLLPEFINYMKFYQSIIFGKSNEKELIEFIEGVEDKISNTKKSLQEYIDAITEIMPNWKLDVYTNYFNPIIKEWEANKEKAINLIHSNSVLTNSETASVDDDFDGPPPMVRQNTKEGTEIQQDSDDDLEKDNPTPSKPNKI